MDELEAEDLFNNIVDELSSSESEVILGKMMRHPGLKYRDKVFAFFHEGEMGFRLGPNFDPDKFGLHRYKPLSPFKSKPPLKGWYIVEAPESDTWRTLSDYALEFTKTL